MLDRNTRPYNCANNLNLMGILISYDNTQTNAYYYDTGIFTSNHIIWYKYHNYVQTNNV